MATLRANRNTVIRKVVEKYTDKDYQSADHFINELIAQLEEIYNDGNLLTRNVELFLEETKSILKNAIKTTLLINRNREKDSCGLLDDSKNNIDTFESQSKQLETDIAKIFDAVEGSLEEMRKKVESKDSKNDIKHETSKRLNECEHEINEEYDINSKKMTLALDTAIKEYANAKPIDR